MYEAYYKLSSDPFRLLPDPEICFPHRSCAKAWAYLRYALKRGEGIVAVTGPPGSGKTTLADRLLRELNPAKTVGIRLIANELSPTDLLRRLAYSFGLPAEGLDRAMLAHRLERYLIDLEHSSRQALVLIDEAQTLSHQSLEAMRLLTDLQSRSRPVRSRPPLPRLDTIAHPLNGCALRKKALLGAFRKTWCPSGPLKSDRCKPACTRHFLDKRRPMVLAATAPI